MTARAWRGSAFPVLISNSSRGYVLSDPFDVDGETGELPFLHAAAERLVLEYRRLGGEGTEALGTQLSVPLVALLRAVVEAPADAIAENMLRQLCEPAHSLITRLENGGFDTFVQAFDR